jgi:hypothetical protein
LQQNAARRIDALFREALFLGGDMASGQKIQVLDPEG